MTATFAEIRLQDILHVARRRGASDVHLACGAAPALRVDGRLEAQPGPLIAAEETAAIAEMLFGSTELAMIHAGHDRSKATRSSEFGTIRVHAFKCNAGIVLAMRLLQEEIPSLESMLLPPAVTALASKERGLVIFAGPTGSGKSTSLAALIDRINTTSARRIVTIEDPVEYRHENKNSIVTQREIGSDTRSFAAALQGALRADPEVIMVGEMRERATMRAALTAAETGHLVLTTLHTGDAPQTIDRIVDAFDGVEQTQVRVQLSQVLDAVVCQRLIPRHGRPGRRALAEVLIANAAVRNLIREGRTHQLHNAMFTGRQTGMLTFEEHLKELIGAREVDAGTAIAV
jgi:twitching motility protein PilT